ncbi:hypothetical protein Pelo_16841 [Pelomyxa schiedti]|nr:hypothetical protein Pelo_16841 [Pelomyxa schiedti]
MEGAAPIGDIDIDAERDIGEDWDRWRELKEGVKGVGGNGTDVGGGFVLVTSDSVEEEDEDEVLMWVLILLSVFTLVLMFVLEVDKCEDEVCDVMDVEVVVEG